MPFTPDTPFPKSRGDTVRSGDWNAAVTEILRLDTAKVDRSGDVISGSLTIDGANANSDAPTLDIVRGDVRWGRSRLSIDQGGSIELGADNTTAGSGGTPYIDFHFGNATEDWNVRVINDADHQLRIDTVGGRGRLVVGGELRVEGAQNIIKVWTKTFSSTNDGVGRPHQTTVDYTAAGFTQVYCVLPVLQAFCISKDPYTTTTHSADPNAIPQVAWVRLEAGWDNQKARVTTYCSESNPANEADNTVAVTVLVLGRT